MLIHTQNINPLNTEINPICHLLVLLRAHPILHVSRIRVNPYEGLSVGSRAVPCKQTVRSTVGHMEVMQTLCQNA
jgi:hypothetical protein